MVHLNIGLERIENGIKKMSENKVEEKKYLDYLKEIRNRKKTKRTRIKNINSRTNDY